MYLIDGKVGQTFKEPRTGQHVVIERIQGGQVFFRDTKTEAGSEYGTGLGEVFPMGDWEPVEMPEPVILETPWGRTQHAEKIAEGVYRVSTASHGGLRLLETAQAQLPAGVRQMFLNGPEWVEEDCEEISCSRCSG